MSTIKPGLEYFVLILSCLALPGHTEAQNATATPDVAIQSTITSSLKRPDFNNNIYYRNKLEFSVESGYMPMNIPFAFDVFVGGDYSQNPLMYTAVPVFLSLRWQMGGARGWRPLRGNTDLTVTGSATFFPRGAENHYGAFDLGFRRNFVQPRLRIAPYFEVRLGLGLIDAQEPFGNGFAQGQNFTFTLMPGAGARYNFNGRWSVAAGCSYFHVSNAYLSEPKYDDNGINVVGPFFGVNMRLGRSKQ
jgi:hypothetical protein